MKSNTRSKQARRPLKVAYIMSRFPKLTETFVLYEMLAVERLGVQVEVYPLLRQREPTVHADAQPLVDRAHFHPFLSLQILLAQLEFLRRQPAKYFGTWWEVLRGTWGSWNFFVGALGIMPKAVLFARDMQRQGIDHVHAHFANHPTVAAFVIQRLTGIPFSFTSHAHDLHVERRMLGEKVRASKFAVTISEFNRRVMLEASDEAAREKIRVIHCGVDPGLAPANRTDEPGRPLEIVCIASLQESKGHRFLIEACQRLVSRGVNFRCRLIGAGPLRREIESQIASLGLSDHVNVLGGLKRSDVMEVIASSDVATLTCVQISSGRRDGIPVALMEAMAAGLPVVASGISGIPELVEDGKTGMLVAPGDVEAIARALERLARDRDFRARIGAAAQAKVRREFNQQTSAKELVELWCSGAPVL